MDIQAAIKDLSKTITYGNDDYYFSHIFKKTEKIVCAVFYTLETTTSKRTNTAVIEAVEQTAQSLLKQVHCSLRTPLQSRDAVESVGYALLELESALRVLNATLQLPSDLLTVFVQEIDAVTRSLRPYLASRDRNALFAADTLSGARAETTAQSGRQKASVGGRGSVPRQRSQETTMIHKDRKRVIMDVLKEKGQSSIKDISEVVKDCSEKTIQRDLNELIQSGVVLRDGERRWSKYSLA